METFEGSRRKIAAPSCLGGIRGSEFGGHATILDSRKTIILQSLAYTPCLWATSPGVPACPLSRPHPVPRMKVRVMKSGNIRRSSLAFRPASPPHDSLSSPAPRLLRSPPSPSSRASASTPPPPIQPPLRSPTNHLPIHGLLAQYTVAAVRQFYRCGDLAGGFTRLQCPDCRAPFCLHLQDAPFLPRLPPAQIPRHHRLPSEAPPGPFQRGNGSFARFPCPEKPGIQQAGQGPAPGPDRDRPATSRLRSVSGSIWLSRRWSCGTSHDLTSDTSMSSFGKWDLPKARKWCAGMPSPCWRLWLANSAWWA